MTRRFLFPTLMSLALTAPAIAAAPDAPFGIAMGTPVADLDVEKDLGGGWVMVRPPEPSERFETYLVRQTPETGACEIGAIGRDFTDDGFGTDVRLAAASAENALAETYGKRLHIEHIVPDPALPEPHEWVGSVFVGERTHGALWSKHEGSDLPDTLELVMLEVAATSTVTAYLNLTYAFSNWEACEAILGGS